MARWNDEMLDRLADQTQANAEGITELKVAITRLEAKVDANADAIRELREGQAMMMQIIMQQQSSIEELRRDTRNMQGEVRLLLDVLTRNYPNGHQGVN